jgi:2-oxoisovalerate dehydrogenase E1 component alpha subunit
MLGCLRRAWYHGTHDLRFTDKLHPIAEAAPIASFRLVNEAGRLTSRDQDTTSALFQRDGLRAVYAQMVELAIMDGLMYEAQRQGRVSFYMTSTGEEAVHFGSAMALNPKDPVFAQYRETGVLLARGFSVQQCLDQMTGNVRDLGRGRQMPIHYGSQAHAFLTISSPLGTQIPQAVGAAYFLKLQRAVAADNGRSEATLPVCYFGEGAASEGDCHAAFNFAAALKTPLLFICRNNAFAISTPHSEQYAGDGIAARGPGYGITTFRVDGNDLWAMHSVTQTARSLALIQQRPVLIEAMTYRVGHHSTSDDSAAYRKLPSKEELEAACPLGRVRRFLAAREWWSEAEDRECRAKARASVLKALKEAESLPKPAIKHLFTDVYDQITPDLAKQHQQLVEHLAKHPQAYNLSQYSDK